MLTKRTILLLALSTGQRLQTITNIEITNIDISKDDIKIKIPVRLKPTRLGAAQPVLTLPYLHEDKRLNVATTLIAHIKATKKLKGKEESLFIATRKPFKKVSVQTLSRWIHKDLDEAGINTEVFSAYGIKHASTSAAWSKGVDLETIKRTAG